ncbi:unnamed protein product, partial [Menidia menidia]
MHELIWKPPARYGGAETEIHRSRDANSVTTKPGEMHCSKSAGLAGQQVVRVSQAGVVDAHVHAFVLRLNGGEHGQNILLLGQPTTFMPSRTSSLATTAPIPAEAPVTRATLPLQRSITAARP